ncbi:hypothetical protein ACVWYH_006292 [Bradyrhizobium sp. GM24.11]
MWAKVSVSALMPSDLSAAPGATSDNAIPF